MLKSNEIYLNAKLIYKYLNEEGNELEEIIYNNNSNNIKLITTDQSLYEALGSFEDRSKININKLIKMLEVVEINSYERLTKKERKMLTYERIKEIKSLD